MSSDVPLPFPALPNDRAEVQIQWAAPGGRRRPAGKMVAAHERGCKTGHRPSRIWPPKGATISRVAYRGAIVPRPLWSFRILTPRMQLELDLGSESGCICI